MGKRSARTFTKRTIDSIKGGSKKGDWYADRDMPGFLLRVYADGTKTFAVRYTVHGTTIRRIKALGRYGTKTLDEAREAARKILSAAADGGDPLGRPAVPTWAEWTETHLSRLTAKSKNVFHKRLLGFTKETKAKGGTPTDSTFRDIRSRWGARPLDTFRTEDIEAERQAIREKEGKGEGTANRWLAVVAGCFQAAVRAGHIDRNPAANVRAGRENPSRDRVLSPEETKRLLEALPNEPDQHAVAAVLLALLAGARRGEALGLRWSDVNLEEGRATLPDSKSGKRRLFPLVPYLVDFLRDLPREGAFVVAGRGLEKTDEAGKKMEERPRPDIKGAWTRIEKAAGLEGVTFHDLRRTAGLAVDIAGGNLRLTQEFLGHSSPNVTAAVYTPRTLEAVKAAATKAAENLPLAPRRANTD